MDALEYEKVKNLTYLQYCDYLQQKYGIGLSDYMTKSFNKNNKVTRTKDGLIAHHKYEDTMIMLSNKDVAKLCPFEWQKAENIVYCDYLEHLLLHILICQYPSPKASNIFEVGYGGVVDFLVPELNDLYSGWETKQDWRKNCHDKVRNDKDVYLMLIKKFIDLYSLDRKSIKCLKTSFNEEFGGWNANRNKLLFNEFDELVEQKKGIFGVFK